MKKDRLYSVLGWACLAGYLYLFVYLFVIPADLGIGVCIFKHITGIPCPSCGSTRAVKALLHGDIIGSLGLNPIGLLLSLLMLIIPVWLIADISQNKQSLYLFYRRFEHVVRKPGIAAFLIVLVVANWVWGICKGL
ncbi:MAG: DUF2752 domain-containing protein [Flavobacterium sp.]|uniref:DUF2752 domain-containing protein n=1 Tax=Flavobacterium sp. TaxID=239 RepID=UPI00120E2C03|nr:DUF2752 domain-containing protein [Flavobacterium sp.]RZJ68509.1 MAG: DUF2752 domain-containing protein [Flavobacterium sp.]